MTSPGEWAEPAPEDRAARSAEVTALELEVAALRAQRDAAWAQLERMRRSCSWRLTWPLRRLAMLWDR